MSTTQYDPETDMWVQAIPVPYYWSFFPWLKRRLTGWRDAHGRPAMLWLPWQL